MVSNIEINSYTLCAIEPRFDGDDIIYANVKVTPDPDNIVQFIENLKKKIKDDCDIPAATRRDAWDFLCIMN